MRLLLLGTTLFGLLAGLRILLTYNAAGADIGAFDAFASGLMEWCLWIPLAPWALWLARRVEPGESSLRFALGVHGLAGLAASLVHLAAFSALSGLVRMLRFGVDFRIDWASPLLVLLAPGVAIYWTFVVCLWWRRSRERLRALVSTTPAEEPLVRFRAGRKQLFIRAAEVDWVAAAGNYLELHARDTTHLVRETLKDAHAKLGCERFLRIHRSTLVRRDAIRSAGAGEGEAGVVLRDGTHLALGKTYHDALEKL